MAGYEVTFDAARGNVVCRVMPLFSDVEAPSLKRDLTLAVANARRLGPVRVLWDNRAGRALSADTSEMIRVLLIDRGERTDRVAVLVPDSVAKVRARPSMVGGSELFASENAALTWLAVGKDALRA